MAVGVGLASVGLGVAAWGAVTWIRSQILREIFVADACRDAIPVAPHREVLRSRGRFDVPILFSAARDGQPTAVFFHGNAQSIAQTSPLFDELEHDGFGVAAVEYVGYGPDPACKPSEAATAQACADAFSVLEARDDVSSVILVGLSLGTVFATLMASKGFGDRLVLVAPFTSAADIVRRETRWISPRVLLGSLRLDNMAAAADVPVPVLVLSSDADEAFPPDMGKALSAAFPQGHFVEVHGAAHGEMGRYIAAAVRAVVRDPSEWPRTEAELVSGR